ncbi:MAG: histidine kinase N-terminal 7TM domain-containing protein [bacterium]
MDNNQKVFFIVYSSILIQCSITMAITFIRSKRTPALYTFCISQFLVILWLFFGMIEMTSTTTSELLLAIRFTLFPICFISGFWLLFTLFYTESITIKNKFVIFIILMPLLITYIPTLTNKYFYLIVLHKSIENPSITEWGILFKINLTVSYMYIILSAIVIIKNSIKKREIFQKKTLLILSAMIISLFINIYNSLQATHIFDLTPPSFSIFFLLIAIAVFKYNFFDVVPQAAINIFENIEESVFILDVKNNIVKTNKAAKSEVRKIIQNKNITNMIAFFNEIMLVAHNINPVKEIIVQLNKKNIGSFHTQFQIYTDDNHTNKKQYEIYLKTVMKYDGKEFAKIISLKNNTETSRLLIENERSRISGDIHDNLSNMINVVSMNLEYAIKFFYKKEDVLNCINTAYEVANAARIHLRRILEELAPIDIERVGLLSALESLFKKVIGAGTHIDFMHNGIDEVTISKTRHAYVIYKTCMEAINNSFFSGKAKKISFILTYKYNKIKLLISDDGVGCGIIDKGRGLIGMEKRITELGGTVEFESSVNEGFNIYVELPFEQ